MTPVRVRRSLKAAPAALTALALVFSAFSMAWAESTYAFYYPKPDLSGLFEQELQLEIEGDQGRRAARLLEILSENPSGEAIPVFGPGLSVRQVFMGPERTVVVDLALDKSTAAGRGVKEERLVVWALVNTLCLNLEGIDSVKVLVNGDEAPTLFGHVDLTWPLLPDTGLID